MIICRTPFRLSFFGGGTDYPAWYRAYGGFNHVRFLPNGEIVVAPLTLSAGRIQEFKAHLLLLYTGIMRTAADVADSYAQDIKSRGRQLRLMQAMVREGIDILRGEKDIEAFGHLLHDA